MTVGDMLSRMTSAELTEWAAFFELRNNPPKPQQTKEEMRAVLDRMVIATKGKPLRRRAKRVR